MAHALTLRLDDDDRAALEERAREVGVKPGTMARMLVKAGLRERTPAQHEALEALDRMAVRARSLRIVGDPVELVAQAREDLERSRE